VALWREPNFARLWTAHTVSAVGSQVSALALPLVAILSLHATAWEVGVLRAASGLPVLALGLLVGVWVDRLRRRPILVLADLGRALLLGLVPVAALAGWLRIELLYAVALAVGVLNLFFTVASQSFLPWLVTRSQLVEGNSRLLGSTAAASVVGPAIGGWLVQLISAPLAIWADALSFVGSAVLLVGIQAEEPTAAAPGDRRLWAEIRVGLGLLWQDQTLRAVTGAATVGAFGGSMHTTLLVLYATDTLRLTPDVVGLVLAAGGGASLVGAMVATPITARLGPGPALIAAQLVVAIGTVVLATASAPLSAGAFIAAGGQALFSAAVTLLGINQMSLRQAVTPDRLQGRVNASRYVLVYGVQPIGALVAGALGSQFGTTQTLLVTAVIEVVAFAVAVASPLRSIRETPTSLESPDGAQPNRAAVSSG
jgi:MFS family permease